ncbi:site-specific integrase [Rhodoplanes roseus]|uniref:Integrase n=1 Tax=Rhodoplanes roseus TaxID=29409 RepID=A0A327KZJ5_9BRAD|nr:site-specific integrase [Rhodoplanes roseus]RAI42642.1 hypothetical protein CH341_18455 [Rhodoplanes roseus]
MPELATRQGSAAAPGFTDVLNRAADYAAADKAASTRSAYRADWEHFRLWCEAHGEGPLPAAPAAVAAYLVAMADQGRSVSTIARRLAAVSHAHRLAGHPEPSGAAPIKAVLRGIRRTLGVAPSRKTPAVADTLVAMLAQMPDTLTGLRDRALLLIGFAGALRRSELVGLDVADIDRCPQGIVLHLAFSKTDQEGEGQAIAVPHGTTLHPVAALDAWLTAAAIAEGPVFRPIDRRGRVGTTRLTDRSVALIVKRWASAAGLDPATFAGHSLRAGFVTEALNGGVDPLDIARVTRHRRLETLQVYDRRAPFAGHAGKGFL